MFGNFPTFLRTCIFSLLTFSLTDLLHFFSSLFWLCHCLSFFPAVFVNLSISSEALAFKLPSTILPLITRKSAHVTHVQTFLHDKVRHLLDFFFAAPSNTGIPQLHPVHIQLRKILVSSTCQANALARSGNFFTHQVYTGHDTLNCFLALPIEYRRTKLSDFVCSTFSRNHWKKALARFFVHS